MGRARVDPVTATSVPAGGEKGPRRSKAGALGFGHVLCRYQARQIAFLLPMSLPNPNFLRRYYGDSMFKLLMQSAFSGRPEPSVSCMRNM